ncbi:hypothetical protein AAH991_07545 [Microbispora sp. ZYX-F-249]|uniref:Uncharacterized protein n=1 Tax=Microbispora maris TaxID=3144104 RepID=A0ABV0AJV6_9ACTN
MLKPTIAATRFTDPWFTARWSLRRGEPLGLRVAESPPLAAIVVTSPAADHRDPRGLRPFPHEGSTPLYVPRWTKAPGFRRAEQVRRGETREVAGASALGATVPVPVRDAHGHHPLPVLFRTTGTASDPIALAEPDLTVVGLPTGERWEPAR